MRHQQSTSTMFEITNHDFLNDSNNISHSNLPQLHKEYQRYSTNLFDNSLQPPLQSATPFDDSICHSSTPMSAAPTTPIITTNISSTGNLLPIHYYYTGDGLTTSPPIIGTPTVGGGQIVTSTAMAADTSSETAATATIHDSIIPPRGFFTGTVNYDQSNSPLNSPTSSALATNHSAVHKPNQIENPAVDGAQAVVYDNLTEENRQVQQQQQQQQQRPYYQQQLQQRASTSSLTTSASALVANRIFYRQQGGNTGSFRLSSTAVTELNDGINNNAGSNSRPSLPTNLKPSLSNNNKV
ncbi:hypothetical protein BDF20DRAFT_144987 [Mycotypha africana]|uniref:uncharacterized protein n=1 Tax=Mycotypha africana TaxID=64632 RepID=UPI0022FFDA0E|nr:uncharacterized protein BDF20DRAFT_144987 [Mycotypha africana]KAI8969104.1 hypothetical protein BDF20DRAFT_144987 [Mycotypha africana]